MRPLLIDSQLLLLLVVGIASRAYISQHKRLQAYKEADFGLLIEIVDASSAVIVTPNALTETSNLLGYVGEPIRAELYKTFRSMLSGLQELYIESKTATTRSEFVRLGLADAAFLEAIGDDRVLLTADLDLYLAAANDGLNVINFNHIREERGLV